ncbi:MAG: DinB family protein [Gemmatimonadota bacterium]|nr:DinB family protein [Gemmatimonadota bacterium]
MNYRDRRFETPMPQSPARPRPDEYADFYGAYIAEVDGPLLEAFDRDSHEWRAILAAVPADRERHRYAPGKWSVREVVGHVIDAERMFSVRAMAFARGDRSHFPSFDENAYAAASGAGRRPLADLAGELSAVRTATLLLLKSFGEEIWDRRGTASGYVFTVRSLAWIMAGHSRHHRRVLVERYLER